MDTLVYRELRIHEARLLETIDRSERIDARYRLKDGFLVLEAVQEEVLSWDSADLMAGVARVEAVIASAGRALGAWDNQRLVGIGATDTSGVGGDRKVIQLELLYVSAAYRRRGLGRRLTKLLCDDARAGGASAMYISATPTRGTVDAYLRMGATLMTSPDPEMLAREPEDIHLLLKLD